ncbi:MAG: hypothetical protein V3V35_03165 [Dehalococcoidia bacterium]
MYLSAYGEVWTTVIVPDGIPAYIPDDHLCDYPWDINLIPQQVQQAFGSVAVKGTKIAVVVGHRPGWELLEEVLRGATIVDGDEPPVRPRHGAGPRGNRGQAGEGAPWRA